MHTDVIDLVWNQLQDELAQLRQATRTSLVRSERAETAGGVPAAAFVDLPYSPTGVSDGDLMFVADACKSGEAMGAGTGCLCYYDAGTDTWKRVYDDQPPLNAGGTGGGGVASVTASAPLASSGGGNPNISLTGQVPGSQVDLASLAGAAYVTLQQNQDILHSTGWISGGAITNNGDGTITVAAGEGLIRASNSDVATLYTCHWAAAASMALTDATTNYLVVNYNAGVPILAITTVIPTDYNTVIHLATIYRSGTDLHIFSPSRHTVGNAASLTMRELEEIMPFANASGGQISASGTRNIAITAGAWWNGLTRFTTAAFDSSGADRFAYYYRNGGGGWTEVTGVAQINNTQYDNGTGALATLTANRYGVHWVYLGADGDVRVQYGQGDYTLNNAQNATIPTPPPELLADSRLIGKIIIQKSAAAFLSIESALSKVFSPASVSDHNSLSGLQGGTVSEYYHLTSAQNALLSGTQSANTVLAGPTSGGAAVPAFRGIVSADLTTALTTPPAIGGTTPAAGAFSQLTVLPTDSTPGSAFTGSTLGILVSAGATQITAAKIGVALSNTATGTGGANTPFYGASFSVVNNQTAGTMTSVIGLTFAATTNNGATTTTLIASQGVITVSNASVIGTSKVYYIRPPNIGTGSITAHYGMQIANQGNAAITTSYALQIDNQSGSGTNYAIQTGTGLIQFGGDIGFYGVTPIARPAAYTQTYAMATRTHSNPTAATVSDTNGAAGFAAAADRTAVVTAVNNLITDVANVKQVLNQVIDDLQANGLLQ